MKLWPMFFKKVFTQSSFGDGRKPFNRVTQSLTVKEEIRQSAPLALTFSQMIAKRRESGSSINFLSAKRTAILDHHLCDGPAAIRQTLSSKYDVLLDERRTLENEGFHVKIDVLVPESLQQRISKKDVRDLASSYKNAILVYTETAFKEHHRHLFRCDIDLISV